MGSDLKQKYHSIHTVFSARNEIIQKRSLILDALKRSDRATAARLQTEIFELKTFIFKRYLVHIDY
jgi:hypothetical protein